MLERLRGQSDSEPDATTEPNDREHVKEALTADAADALNDPDVTTFYTPVSVETLKELEELDCFEGRTDTSKAISFAGRWDDKTEQHVQVTDTEDCFRVELALVHVTGAVTNDIVEDFADTFSRSISGKTFDPMAENHKRPKLSIQPW